MKKSQPWLSIRLMKWFAARRKRKEKDKEMKQLGLISAIRLTKRGGHLQREDYSTLQIQRLQKLVSFVADQSEYYKRLYRSVSKTNFLLAALPPTNKVELMAHFDTWLTDSQLTLETVNRFMENSGNIGRKLNGKYLVYTTSGSTGNPSICVGR